MIAECRCPRCGELIEDYWDFGCEQDYGVNEYWTTYRIECDCGCHFAYTEIYELAETEIVEY